MLWHFIKKLGLPMDKQNILDTILSKLYYHDPDELGEDAFKNCGDDEIADIKQQIALAIERAKPDTIEVDRDPQTGAPLGRQGHVDHGHNNGIEDYHNNLKRELGL